MTDMTVYRGNSGLDIMSLGHVLAQSGYFQDAKDEAQAIVKVLAGAEMGIGAIAAMTGIYIVKGRVTLSANLMASQIKRSGKYDYRVRSLTDQECAIEFFQGGESIGVSSFTLADARRAGTQNTDRFPRNMLFARAMSNGVKWYTPDIFTGPVYVPGEIVPADGDTVPPPIDTTTGEILDTQGIEPPSNGHAEPPAPVKRLPSEASLRKAIKERWAEERALGGTTPADELACDLEELAYHGLMGIGAGIAARIKILKAAATEMEPAL